jgi:hypothetical protein
MNDEQLIEMLLYKGEGAALDYKVQQYPHDGATPDEKGELLKDILAFSNAWREETAYILIGVSNSQEVIGLDKDLDDSRLQQFINEKTNIPVDFSYRSLIYKGFTLGLYTIYKQERPIYAKQKYGKVSPDTVYVRRGSSTAIAKPDEVAKMGAAIASEQVSHAPIFSAKVIFSKSGQPQEKISINYKNFVLLKNEYPMRSGAWPGGGRVNLYYYRDLAKHIKVMSGIFKFSLEIKNIGSNYANDVKIHLSAPSAPDFYFLEDFKIPAAPHQYAVITSSHNILAQQKSKVRIHQESGCEFIVYSIDKIQAGATFKTQTCCIVSAPVDLKKLNLRFLSDQLRAPVEMSLDVEVSAVDENLTLEMLQDDSFTKAYI